MDLDIRHDTTAHRFSADVEGGEARLEYHPIDDRTYDYTSTFVPEAAREKGVGESLVLHALDWARKGDARVIPSCPFVRRVIDDNPEYETLIRPSV